MSINSTLEESKNKTKQLSGGFKVESEAVEPPEIEQAVEAEAGEETAGAEISPEAILEVNKALIETACMVISKIVVLLTKMDEMAFDEDETQQLVELWSPLVPSLSARTTAILGTLVIVGGKISIYFMKKREESPEHALKGEKLGIPEQGSTVSEKSS